MTEETVPDVDLNEVLDEHSTPPLKFPSGLIGLEQWQNFVIMSHPQGDPLKLLQSLDEPRLSFIMANPWSLKEDYRGALSAADARAIGYEGNLNLKPDGPLAVYCMLSVQDDPFLVTANLLGPLVINWETNLGRQVILSAGSYPTNHVVFQANNNSETKGV